MITWKQVLQHLTVWFVDFVWRMLGALAVLALGLLVVSLIYFIIGRFVRRDNGFQVRRRLIVVRGMLGLAVLVATATLMLVALGVAGSVIGFIVTLGLALGVFADSLGGFRILLLRPFEIGDTLELKGEGLKGVVAQTTLSGIVLLTSDGAQVLVSNRKLFENPIINHTSTRTERLLAFHLEVGLGVGIPSLEQQIRSLAAASPGAYPHQECRIKVTRIEADFVTFIVQFSVPAKSADDPSTEFLKMVKADFDRQHVSVRLLQAIES